MSSLKETLDAILKKYTLQPGDTDTEQKLIAAGFFLLDKNGQPLYLSGSGRTKLSEPAGNVSPPCAADGTSLHWIASMTKLLTTVCALQQVEAGRIGLHDDVRSWLPELAAQPVLISVEKGKNPVTEPNNEPITLWNLITHTSGLAYDNGDVRLMKWSTAIGRPQGNFSFTPAGWAHPLVYPPGKGWCYGPGIDWAGILVCRLSGAPSLGEYMRQHIFSPLGMADSTMCPFGTPNLEARVVDCTGAGEVKGKRQLVPEAFPVDFPNRGVDSGGAGLFTTPADYAKFLGAFVRDAGRLADGKKGELLKRETVDLMFQPQLSPLQKTTMLEMIDKFPGGYIAEFMPSVLGEQVSARVKQSLNWGLAGMINTVDVPGKRKAGSMMWSGLTGGHWWVDRTTGIAAGTMTHVLPPGDVVNERMFHELETAVYAHLAAA